MHYGELADHDSPTTSSSSLRMFPSSSSTNRGSILEKSGAYSEMSLGLDDIMCSSALDGSLRDNKPIGGGGNGKKLFSPTMRRRSSLGLERSDRSNYSEMSLGLDDICSALDGSARDGVGGAYPMGGGTYPMPCLNEESREFEMSSGAGGGSCFFDLGEDDDDDDDYYLQNDRKEDDDDDHHRHQKHHHETDDKLRRLDDSRVNRISFMANQSLINWTSYEPDNRDRKVRFSNNEPEVRSFPKPPGEENSTFFYDSTELQEMLDEFLEEERSSKSTVIR